MYANSGSGLLFIMCGHCSPVVVWYNYQKYLSNTLRYLLYAEGYLSGIAYIGEVLLEIWLKSMKK